MQTIDKKDKQILHQFNEDAAQSLTQIGRNVSLSKQVVKYRIDTLFRKKIIKETIPLINVSRLGFTVFNAYLKIENPSIKILKRLISHPNIPWLISTGGHYNFACAVFAKDFKDMSKIIVDISKKCDNKLLGYETLIVYEKYPLGYRFLDSKRKLNLIYAKECPLYTNKNYGVYTLSQMEIEILKQLANYDKSSILNIARESKLSYTKVSSILKKLKQNDILKGIKPILDTKQLGYQWYQVLMNLNTLDENEFNRFITYLISIPKITHINCCFGKWNINFELNVENHAEYLGIMNSIQTEFSHMIRDQEELIIFDEHKYNFLVGCITNEIPTGS